METKPVIAELDILPLEGDHSQALEPPPVSAVDSALSSSDHAGVIIKEENRLMQKRKGDACGQDGAGMGEYIEEEDDEECRQSSLKRMRFDAEAQVAAADKTASVSVAKCGPKKRSQASRVRRDLKQMARKLSIQAIFITRAIRSSNRPVSNLEVAKSLAEVLTEASEAAAKAASLCSHKSKLPTLANDRQSSVEAVSSLSNEADNGTPHVLPIVFTSTTGIRDTILCLDVEVVSDGTYSQFSQLGAVLSAGGRISTFEAKV
jgi:hypothetical protein